MKLKLTSRVIWAYWLQFHILVAHQLLWVIRNWKLVINVNLILRLHLVFSPQLILLEVWPQRGPSFIAVAASFSLIMLQLFVSAVPSQKTLVVHSWHGAWYLVRKWWRWRFAFGTRPAHPSLCLSAATLSCYFAWQLEHQPCQDHTFQFLSAASSAVPIIGEMGNQQGIGLFFFMTG